MISIMSGKLKGLLAINTSPFSNRFCMRKTNENEICTYCYSKFMLKTLRKNAMNCFERNAVALSTTDVDPKSLRIRKGSIVRINAHGDFINKRHVRNVLRIIEAHPDCTFAIWTKRPNLLKGISFPRDVILVYSTIKINELNPVLPEGFNKVFSVYTKDFAQAHNIEINCHGKCIDCMLCYTHNDVVYINELLKQKKNVHTLFQ